jgi:hypothetical protein
MTLPAIWQAIQRILSILGTLQTLLGIVNGNTSKAAQENVPFAIETSTAITQGVVTDAVIGNANIFAAIGDVELILAANQTALLAAIGAAQQTGLPVTLPTTPPAGYGADATTIGAAVWAYPSALTGQNANDRLDDAYLVALNFSDMSARVPNPGNRYIDSYGTWVSPYGVNGYNSQPLFPVANILSTDTLLTFLERESVYTGWAYNDDDYAYVTQGGSGNPFGYITTINAQGFILLRDGTTPAGSAVVPPVWPGLANVTLGTPVAITSQMTVTDDMDGVIISITSVTTNKPSLAYDAELAYKFIGALAFVTDNGDVETFQPLAFTHALYCPQRMTRAASVVLRVDAGVAGTVTPWVAV